MARASNPSIGTCPCPFKACEQVCCVFKFRGRSDNAARHRYAGKLYCHCPVHGRIESQEWILENARIETSALDTSPAPNAAAVAPVDDQSPATGAASRAPVSSRSSKPAAAAARSVTTSNDAVPAAERARVRWGFFE